jgi:hypothetical protein
MNGPADVMIQTEGNHEMDKTGQGTLNSTGIDGRSSRLYHHIGVAGFNQNSRRKGGSVWI